jgi:hypothetical protein
MRGLWLGAAAWLLLASGSTAFAACEGSAVLFEDRFDALQPTWGEPSEILRTEENRLVVTPEPDSYFWVTNQASVYDDIDMCVALTTVTGVDPEDSKAGLLFWYIDSNNFYVLEIAPNGKASVWRRQRGKWLEQVEWKDVNGMNSGDDATNELRIVTKGSHAVFYINDMEFAELNGVAPDNGQQIGVFAVSPEAGVARFAFDNLKITRP